MYYKCQLPVVRGNNHQDNPDCATTSGAQIPFYRPSQTSLRSLVSLLERYGLYLFSLINLIVVAFSDNSHKNCYVLLCLNPHAELQKIVRPHVKTQGLAASR